MSLEAGWMAGAGLAVLAAGLGLARGRFNAAAGAEKVLVLGPVFEAVALAMFAAEHFTAARDLMGIVPKWLPGPLFWVYFVGTAWVAAAVSMIVWREVRWSAAGVWLLMWTFVATLDVPMIPRGPHDRFFWILTVRETAFGSGALVLAGSLWPGGVGAAMMRAGRWIVGAVMIFYGIEHFLHPLHVPGVPLEMLTPGWIPAPQLIAGVAGVALAVGGVGLLLGRWSREAAAGAGVVLVLLTALFYVPIFVLELHTAKAVEGLNYIGDTALWAATVMLAGVRCQVTGDR